MRRGEAIRLRVVFAQIVELLIVDIPLGFEGVDAGPLASARLLEPLALLWISGAYRFGLGRDYAFALVRRSSADSN